MCLDDPTAKATDEMSSHIASVQSATTEAVDAIGTISTMIGESGHISDDDRRRGGRAE